MDKSEIQKRLSELEEEKQTLQTLLRGKIKTVQGPKEIQTVFDEAEINVGEYFEDFKRDPEKATIEINGERYVLVRASAFSKDFLETIKNLYKDRGSKAALNIGKNFLFDIAHVIGINDAQNFHKKMNLSDPLQKLSAGPVHFAYSGWASVEILPGSNPTPDENFYLIYNHPYSFEAYSWMKEDEKTDTSICIMNAGYSSGWCEESFGIPLTAVEVTCKAKGDENCTFIMSPPESIARHLEKYSVDNAKDIIHKPEHSIPSFFERKRVEEEMEKARLKAEASDNMKSQFIANMSHEMRTPLNAIIGFSNLLKYKEERENIEEYAKMIETSGKQLLRLVDDVLDLSSIESHKLSIRLSEINVRDFLSGVKLAADLILSDNQEVVLELIIDQNVPETTQTDSNRLNQVFTNLINNAIKFTKSGTITIHVRYDEDKGEIVYTVRDTGIGISKAEKEKVFSRFYQTDISNTRKYGGSGIGLSIAKEIIELLGGELFLESELGVGSRFWFNLPHERNVKLKKINTVLVVEDNEINQIVICKMLDNLGLRALVASAGADAYKIYEEKSDSVDAILMDIQMPGMDGIETTKRIRDFENQKGLTQVLIISMSAVSEYNEVKNQGVKFDACLEKPMNMDALREVLFMSKQT